MANTYKAMFWNIQNLYEYKAVEPSEVVLANQGGGGLKKAMDASAQKIADKLGSSHRNSVIEIIKYAAPDLLIVVEFAVGKIDLAATGSMITASTIAYDHFAPLQMLVGLSTDWHCGLSWVNASDIVITAPFAGELDIKSKNSMFEQYAVFWNSKKFGYPGPVMDSYFRIPLLDRNTAGAPIPFVQRYPGGIVLTENGTNKPFTIVMNHSVWGSTVPPRKAAIGNIAQLAEVVTSNPILVSGDFNVDYNTTDYNPLITLNLKSRIGNQKTATVKADGVLKNAYDQIFTRQLGEGAMADGKAFNFVEECLYGDYALGAAISDHLPVVAPFTIS